MVARLTLRQGGEAVFLLLQRARWDTSGRLVAMDLIRDVGINLGMAMGIGTSILVTNISSPFGYTGKGRDVLLLIRNSRHCDCLNVVSQTVPSVPLRHHGFMDLQLARS